MNASFTEHLQTIAFVRSSHPEVFLGWKSVLIICSKLKGKHQNRSVISIKLQGNFIEITLWHGYSPVICCIFSVHLFLRKPLSGCFSIMLLQNKIMCSHLLNMRILTFKWQFVKLIFPKFFFPHFSYKRTHWKGSTSYY